MISNSQLKQIKSRSEELMANSGNILHDEKHVRNVTNNALEIVYMLGIIETIDVNLLATCTYTHDLTYSKSPNPILAYFFEGRWVVHPVKALLLSVGVLASDINVVINAVSRHPHSFPFKRLNKDQDVYTKVLQDSDTIDLFNIDRIKKLFSQSGMKSKLSRQFISYGSRNLEKYLNYPEIAGYFRNKYIKTFED